MKALSEMSVGEVAAYVAGQLRQSDINVVLTGGSCVLIYTDNRYLSPRTLPHALFFGTFIPYAASHSGQHHK